MSRIHPVALEIREQIERNAHGLNYYTRLHLLETVLGLVGENITKQGNFMQDAYLIGAKNNASVLPYHYYSPISPDEDIERHVPGQYTGAAFADAMSFETQDAYFKDVVCKHARELQEVPFEADSGIYHWLCGMFGLLDGSVYYATIREHRPATVLEVGSGYSTLMAIKAAQKNNETGKKETKVVCIEPYPNQHFNNHLPSTEGFELIVAPVQEVDLDVFRKLKKNDILFIDSSHVVKPGSDVETIIFHILPVLKPGVLVHFHDIFYPFRYPKHFYTRARRYWNENYVLSAFLYNNPDWEVLISNAAIRRNADEAQRDMLLKAALPENGFERGSTQFNGGSLWIRRTGDRSQAKRLRK